MKRRKGDEISYYWTNKAIRKKIDKLLIRSNTISSNLGIDSTPKEKEAAKVEQRKINIGILELDPFFFPGEPE